jgi:hypothetical protein
MANLLRNLVNYELKLQNRFILEFPNELDLPSWLVQSVTRPSLEIEGVAVGYLNTEQYVRTRYKFSDFEVVFIDPLGPSTSQKIQNFVHLSIEELTGRMGFSAGYSKTFNISTLDPTGVPVEVWQYVNCQITGVEWGEYTYDDGAIIKPKVKFQPQFATQLY